MKGVAIAGVPLIVSAVVFCVSATGQEPGRAPVTGKCVSPEVLKLQPDPAETHVDYGHFFPIGWSRDGKFAYAIQGALVGDSDLSTVVILAAAGGSSAWSLRVEETFDQEERESEALDKLDCREDHVRRRLEGAWRPNVQLINSKLKEHGIVSPTGGWKLLAGDRLTWFKKDDFSLKTTVKSIENEHFPGVACVLDYRLSMRSKKHGAKVVHERKYDRKSCPIAITVKGALKSPYESRIVLILEENSLGFEGTQNNYLIVGSHLEAGFK